MSRRLGEAPKLQEILEQALARYNEGRLEDTATLCRQILKTLPDSPGAPHLLGVVHLLNGNAKEAALALTAAADVEADNAEILDSLGAALGECGDLEQAEASHRRAVKLAPRTAGNHFNLGKVLRARSQAHEAEKAFRKTLRLEPDHLEATNHLGLALEDQGRTEAALEMYRRAIAAAPGDVEGHRNAATLLGRMGDWASSLANYDIAIAIEPDDGNLHAGRGKMLGKLGRLKDASAAFRRALDLDPLSSEARLDFARALSDCGRLRESLGHYQAALMLAPDDPDINSELGCALVELGRYEEAMARFDRALVVVPEHVGAWTNRGHALRHMGRLELALEAYDAALYFDYRHREARFGRATMRLLKGNFGGGWRDYLARPALPRAPEELHRETLPKDLDGKRIMLIGETDLGEELFFLRFAPLLAARGAIITYRGDRRLSAMMRRSGLFEDASDGVNVPDGVDWTIAAGDLPHLLSDAGARSPPAPFPILPEPAREAEIAARLRKLGPPPYVGVTWRGATAEITRAPSLQAPSELIARALSDAQGTVIALQRNPAPGEIDQFATALGRPIADLTDINSDLEDILALMGLLDDYVCVGNTNVHFRAARGRPCRVLVPLHPEFCWMAWGSRSPWFPEMPLYRQAPNGGWDTTLDWLARDFVVSHGPARTG